MRFARLSALLFGLPTLVLAQEAPPENVTDSLLSAVSSNINIEGLETGFDPETGIATAKGDVNIKYGDTEILAGRADYNSNTGDVIAKEDVTIVKAGVTYKGENITYNLKTNKIHGDAVRSAMTQGDGTLFYTMDDLETETKYVDRIDGKDAYFTTHDLADPNYRIRAKKLTIYPNDRVVMKNVTVLVGDTPVFWLPYLSQPLDDELGYKFTPGYSSNWGGYLLNQYGVIHGDHTLAQYKLDLRSSRGVAGGVDFISLKQKDNKNWGRLKLYYAADSDPTLNHANQVRPIDTDDQRYRVNFQHRIYITGPAERTWYLDFDINKISDEFFYEDFFMNEYRADREPDNHISLVRSDPRYTSTLMAKFELNDYYQNDSRLPELAFDFTRQPIFNSGFFYQGNSSLGILEERRGSSDKANKQFLIDQGEEFLNANSLASENGLTTSTGDVTGLAGQSSYRRALGLEPDALLGVTEVEQALEVLKGQIGDSGFTRFHSYHEVLYPKTVFGWLTLVPRLGLGYQHYSSIDGGPDGLDSDGRPLVHAGLDASFKFSRTWDDLKNETLGIDGLKHTVQPYLNYSYLNADQIEGLPAIDRDVPTTRPRPLDVPLYSGIDSFNNWSIARVGVRNLLQTRRDYTSYSDSDEKQFRKANDSATQTYNWAGLNTYVDVFMDDPEFDRSTGNLFNELFFRPTPWLSFFADTQVPMGGDKANFTEANYGVTFLPMATLSVTLGQQFITDHPFFEDSSLVYSRIYTRLNDNWGFSMNHIYEMEDSTLEYQSYSVHRDLSSWVASLGGLVRDNRGVTDYGVVFSLTLKDFPQVSIPLDTNPNPTGRSGQR